jgi:hypothetical protein
LALVMEVSMDGQDVIDGLAFMCDWGGRKSQELQGIGGTIWCCAIDCDPLAISSDGNWKL